MWFYQFIALFPLVTAYDPSSYTHSRHIATGFNIHWSISGSQIELALTAPTAAWVALGIAEPGSGSMPGADIAACIADSAGAVRVSDMHSVAFSEPKLDEQQDWELVEGSVSSSTLSCVIRRQLDTGEMRGDRPILDNGVITKMIFAHGAAGAIATGSLSFHSTKAWPVNINFFSAVTGNAAISALADYSGEYIDVTNSNFEIPALGDTGDGTTYHNVCYTLPAQFNASLLAFEAIISTATQANIHHFTLSGFTDTTCSGSSSMLWVWTPGQEPYIMPDNVGFKSGNATGEAHAFRSFNLNTHYDNPSLEEGKIDSSGVRIHHTAPGSFRSIEAGIIQFGDGPVALQDPTHPDHSIPVGYSRSDFSCNTSDWPHEITVVGHFLHMHELGVKMTTNVSRSGSLLRSNSVEFYQFSMQSEIRTPSGYTVLPGDHINTRCYYYNDGSQTRVWGLSSANEMCIDFVMYYPRMSGINEFCGGPSDTPGSYDGTTVLSSEAELHRKFGVGAEAVGGDADSDSSTGESDASTTVAAAAGAVAGVLLILGAVLALRKHADRKPRQTGPDVKVEDGSLSTCEKVSTGSSHETFTHSEVPDTAHSSKSVVPFTATQPSILSSADTLIEGTD